MGRLWVLWAACTAVTACSSTSPTAATAVEAAAPDANAAPTWVTHDVLVRGHGLVVERVTYLSGKLRIFGQVCRPDDGAAHPVLMVDHGGFEGNDDAFAGDLARTSLCLGAASAGYVIGESSYRGEDGSDGQIEGCLGEVDDVVAMLAILRAQSYVDPARAAAFGGSHGGCITTMLALRDPTLKAAVDFFGPSDVAALDTWWHAQVDQNEPASFCAPGGATSICAVAHRTLIRTVEAPIGGPPSAANASAYAARSTAPKLAALTVPMAFFQGTSDAVVNLEQVCTKRAVLVAANRAPQAWYLDGNLMPKSPPGVCGGHYRTDAVPDTSNAAAWGGTDTYFFVYEGQGHGFTGQANSQADAIGLEFVFAHPRER
jgi:pimeloyl-ACP methyl ester carboxylesterase